MAMQRVMQQGVRRSRKHRYSHLRSGLLRRPTSSTSDEPTRGHVHLDSSDVGIGCVRLLTQGGDPQEAPDSELRADTDLHTTHNDDEHPERLPIPARLCDEPGSQAVEAVTAWVHPRLNHSGAQHRM